MPVIPNGGAEATYRAICAASNDDTVPLLLTSATNNCVAFNIAVPATCCAIFAASNEVMLFAPPVLLGVTVYEPAPNPVSEYWPAVTPGAALVVIIVGEPAAVIVALETKRGFGAPIALPYMTVPLTAGVGVPVAVADGVFV